MIAYLSRLFASLVMCSEKCAPGTAVGIALNSPRYSSGASGLGSNVSKWVGPPSIQMRMHDFAFASRLLPPSAARARARRAVASPPPSRVPSPSCRQSRRFIPAQFFQVGITVVPSLRGEPVNMRVYMSPCGIQGVEHPADLFGRLRTLGVL